MKKKVLIVLGILIGILSILGISYAYWMLSFKQTNVKAIKSSCIQVTFSDENPNNLGNAYPMDYEDISSTTPYTFTITNTCSNFANYQINLESLVLEDGVKRLDDKYIDISLENYYNGALIDKEEVTPTLEEADKAYLYELFGYGKSCIYLKTCD